MKRIVWGQTSRTGKSLTRTLLSRYPSRYGYGVSPRALLSTTVQCRNAQTAEQLATTSNTSVSQWQTPVKNTAPLSKEKLKKWHNQKQTMDYNIIVWNRDKPRQKNDTDWEDELREQTTEEDAILSKEQKIVVDLVLAGRNIFFTGSAGVGKTFLLKSIIKRLELAGKKLAITASTGVAAVHIGGQTLHSFAGVGLGGGSTERLLEETLSNKKAVQRWKRTQVLIIDEVSMVRADLLDKLDKLAQHVKGSTLPFGGIQLVFCGDFYQLPPVTKLVDCSACGTRLQTTEKQSGISSITCTDCGHTMKILAFQSDSWKAAELACIELQTVFRQTDSEFIAVLNQIRKGQVTPQAMKLLEQCRVPLTERTNSFTDLLPTKLHVTRAQVADENRSFFEKLPGPTMVYDAIDGPDNMPSSILENCFKDTRLERHLELKVGAQVMLLTNLSLRRGLVNGSRGVVVGFVPEREVHRRVLQIMRTTKCRGLQTWDPQWNRHTRMFPVVRFANGEQCAIYPIVNEVVLLNRAVVYREQIPLKLAWSLTVHKCQGLSLDCVQISLNRAFAPGQAYVALSRARSLDGLELVDFNESHVSCHQEVQEFYSNMQNNAIVTTPMPLWQKGRVKMSKKRATRKTRL